MGKEKYIDYDIKKYRKTLVFNINKNLSTPPPARAVFFAQKKHPNFGCF
jgi:hypothetical protein